MGSPEKNALAAFVSCLVQDVAVIVRLCSAKECREHEEYAEVLESLGIHEEAFEFQDGTAPPADLIKRFLETCEKRTSRNTMDQNRTAIVIHCMSGLGRTGSMAAAYAVANHGISGDAFLGWARLCRPGSMQTLRQEAFVRRLRPPSKPRAKMAFATSLMGCVRSYRSDSTPSVQKISPPALTDRSRSKESSASTAVPSQVENDIFVC
jgi:protein-tyrosine phosphatase